MKTVFGIRSISINGHTIYTCHLLVNAYSDNIDILNNHRVEWKYNAKRNKCVVSFITLDAQAFAEMIRPVGQAMMNIAQRKLNERYCWVTQP